MAYRVISSATFLSIFGVVVENFGVPSVHGLSAGVAVFSEIPGDVFSDVFGAESGRRVRVGPVLF